MKRFARSPRRDRGFPYYRGRACGLAQATFKIPYKFEAGGKKLPAGTYWIGTKDDGQLVIRQEAKNIEISFPFSRGWPSPRRRSPSPSWSSMWSATSSRRIRSTSRTTCLSEVWFPGPGRASSSDA